MTKKIVLSALVALVVVGIAAPSASAFCNPPKATGSGLAYFIPTIPAPTTAIGRIWSGTTDHTGTCNEQNFVYFYGPGVSMNLSLGDACVVGCPAGTLSLQVTVGNAAGETQTLTTQTTETPTAARHFDYETGGNLNLGTYPRPRATSSSRAGSLVNLAVGVDAVSAFAYNGTAAQITGYNIVAASSATDPGPSASAYAVRVNAPAPGGGATTASTSVDCTNTANDQWVAAQLVTTAGPSNSVGARTRVKCDPNLANPKFNVVPKKSLGTGTSH